MAFTANKKAHMLYTWHKWNREQKTESNRQEQKAQQRGKTKGANQAQWQLDSSQGKVQNKLKE